MIFGRGGPSGPTSSDEPFELLELLGTGGFAHTYRARVRDRDLVEEYGRDEVALKLPLDRKKQRVLRKEVELNTALYLRLKSIASPNLVQYLGFEIFRGQLVMVMEYIPGGSLRQRVGKIASQSGRPNRPLPTEEALQITQGILSGLEVIHREHIFHRDIKPENILMDGDIPKISDLGISRILDTNELASTTAGTPYYMSPEILGEAGASYTADIWAVGVTLYEMVTGRLPFGHRETPLRTLIDLICEGEPEPPCRVADVPPALEAVILKALAKDPQERFSSAAEMRQALERCLLGPEAQIEEEVAAIWASMAAGDSPTAIEARLQKLIQRFPKSPSGYRHLGEFYNRCQRNADAVRAFRQGIAQNRQDALLHWNLGLTYQKQGKKDKAIAALEEALALGLDESLQRYARQLLRMLQGSGT